MKRPAGRRLVPAVALALAALFAAAGCTRGDPRAAPIPAATAGEFSRWRVRTADRLTAEEWREFDAMLQEVRLRIMAERAASGSEAIEAELRTRIAGLTPHEVLVLGYQSRLRRLREEGAGLVRALEQNSRLMTKPGDTASERYLDDFSRRQMERFERVERETEATEARLRALGAPLRAPAPETPPRRVT